MIHIIGILSLFCCTFVNAAKVFEEIRSGTCGDESGRENIVTDTECVEAATALGLRPTQDMIYKDDPWYKPAGCYIYMGRNGPYLVFNQRLDSTDESDKYYQNICTVTLPACTNTDGSAPNSDDPCICGNMVCRDTASRYCYESESRCSQFANAKFTFIERTSGVCGDSIVEFPVGDLGLTRGPNECEEGATALGWSYPYIVQRRWDTSVPYGCFFKAFDGLLYFNRAPSGPTCQTWAKCMCPAAGPVCTNTDGSARNSGNACLCGTVACDATTGLYCVASKNFCTSSPICSNTDGSTANSADCACGTANCDGTTGLFCFAVDNRCRFATCSNTDGSTANSADCACGTEDCDATTGLYCDTSKNHCDKLAGPYSNAYLIVTSGTCASNGYGYIEDAATCGAAAGQVGWALSPDTGAALTYSGLSFPRGCWNSENRVVHFTTNTASTRSCDYSGAEACLCAITAGVCPHHDGATANPVPCICGASGGCTSATGFFCDTSNNDRCSQFATCSNTDGTTANSADCACGTANCDGTTGFFCFADENRCDFVPCVNTNGMVVNSKTCTCGNADCKDEKLFCDTSNNDRCSSTHKCANTNGMVVNEDNCACGTADCTTDTGLFCDKSKSHCNNFLYCANTNGSTVNSADCTCGTAVCDASSGRFCYAPENLCMDFAHPRRIGTEVGPVCPHDDGTTDNAGSVTYNVGWCKCGNKVCTSNSDGQGTGMVCTAASNTCSRPQACTNTDFSAHNSAACACGTVDCAGGEYCWEYHSRCAQFPHCAVTDGSAPNSAECACGTADCKVGEYCYYGTEDWLTQWGLCRDSSDGQLC